MTITTSQFIAINTGLVANDKTGDDLRTAFTKVNNNLANIADIGFDSGNISVTGQIIVSGNVTAGNVSATNLTGTLQTAAQPNITSVGTLTGLTSSGPIHITDSTNSTAFNNGALIVNGGLGVTKDVYIQGNLYFANILATSAQTLITTSPLVYFDSVAPYPYAHDIGFYSHFTGGVGNVYQHTGFVRNDTDSKWYLFSNVAEPTVTQISLTNAKYDTMVLGNIELKAPTPTAITNGGTNATGNIGASGATFNYGYFTNLTGTLQTASQTNITGVGNITTGTWSSTLGAVSGANLTSLTAANLTGTIPSAVLGNSTVYIGTTAIALNRASAIQTLTGISIDGHAGAVSGTAITGASLPTTLLNSSLTSVGTLSSLSVTGNIRTNGTLIANGAVASTSTTSGALQVTGGAGITGNLNVGGNIAAPYFIGNGSQLTGVIPGAVVTAAGTAPVSPKVNDVWYDTSTDILFLYINDGDSNQWVDISSAPLATTTGNPTAIVSGAGLSITGTSSISGVLSVLGGTSSTTSTTGQLKVTGGVGITENLYVGGNIGVTGGVTASSFSGPTAGTHTGSVIGNVSGNLTGTHTGAVIGDVTGNLTGNSAGTHTGAVIGDVTGNVSGSASTVTTAAQTAITSVGTLTALTVSGAITVNSGNAVTAIVNGGTTGVGNIGSSTKTFNTVFATATTATYADLAEKYPSDAVYAPGTVVVFGGTHEITVSTKSHDPAVAGVISTNPAYLMNNGIDGLEVALTGRVPCWVQGPINKGDRLVSSDTHGIAQRIDLTLYSPGCIIGKSLELIETNEIKLINIAIGRF